METEIRPLVVDDAIDWRDLRLMMLCEDPQGFYADFDLTNRRSDEDWRRNIPAHPDVILGLFSEGELAGSAGFYVENLPKLSHKGQMWGVYVRPDLRRRGNGLRLVQAVIGHAREHVDVLLTGASTAGAPIYKRAGFDTFGIERDAFRVDGVSLDSELMAIRFRTPAA